MSRARAESTGTRMQRWRWLHTWSSLVCTVFMLVLCVTGLPLVFSHEIRHLTQTVIEAPALPVATPRASLDRVVETARGFHPALVPLYLFAEEDEPALWTVKMDTRPDTDESAARFVVIDARTALPLGEPRFDDGFMSVMYRLHVDLFAGLAGKLFLGLMGVLLLVALVSGVVLYVPFMRKLAFGTVRRERAPRIVWLDLHNMLGIVTVAWALVVGATGVVNTWADLILQAWQREQVTALRAGHADATAPVDGASLQAAADVVLAAFPDKAVSTIAFPGTLLSTPAHFTFMLRGNTPLTSKLVEPVLVDPLTSQIIDAAPRPWYATALLLSQPLHFGDYGALPLKVLWAALDAITIVVLWSGVVLWWRKRRAAKAADRAATRVAESPA